MVVVGRLLAVRTYQRRAVVVIGFSVGGGRQRPARRFDHQAYGVVWWVPIVGGCWLVVVADVVAQENRWQMLSTSVGKESRHRVSWFGGKVAVSFRTALRCLRRDRLVMVVARVAVVETRVVMLVGCQRLPRARPQVR